MKNQIKAVRTVLEARREYMTDAQIIDIIDVVNLQTKIDIKTFFNDLLMRTKNEHNSENTTEVLAVITLLDYVRKEIMKVL